MNRRLLVGILTTMALAAAACGGNGTGSATSTPTPAPTPKTVSFTETEFKIDTASTTLKAGSYIFMVQNSGKFPHDLHIATPDGSELAKTDLLQPSTSGTVQVTLKAGTYTIWCAVDGHRARGMQGTLTVT
jgi:uncharacterized cupredoxin-like copper-binding protein